VRKWAVSDKKEKLLVFGAAEIAELAAFYFDLDSNFEVVAFVVDDDFQVDSTFYGLPLISWTEANKKFPPSEYKMHVALSYKGLNKLRESKFIQCEEAGYELVSYISSKATIFPDLQIGSNCFVLENQNIQPRVKIGNNVMLWSGNHIGHGSVIKEHAYLASHIVISGHVEIGERCFIGVNASVRDFITIGKDSFVGMGSIVTRNISDGSVVLPARGEVIEGSDPRADKLIKMTFGRLLE
jgi:sugar O-acyltransferase (sialic acid O-acetyltransferase NeuD family)